MKKIFKAIRIMVVNATIFSLIQNPFIANAYAANETAETVGKIGQAFNHFAGTYLSQKQAMRQGQVNAQLVASMSPGACSSQSNSFCQQGPSLYFPECILPASIASMPQNVCSNPQNLGEMLTYEQIANQWTNYYDKMMNKAANSKVVPGLRCLDDRQKAFDSQMLEMQNNLQRLQDQLKKDRENFRNNHKALLDNLDRANDELYGTELNKKNINSKTNHLAKLFSKSCQNVIGDDVMANANQNGLAKISQLLIPVNKSASDFNSNRPMLESELRNDINKLVKQIQDGGLIEATSITPESKFQGVEQAYKQKLIETQRSVARIQKELKDSLDYDIPALDRSFSTDFQEVINQSSRFFENKYINECVTGKDNGVAIPISDILNNISQHSTGSKSAVNDYKVALQNILNLDISFEDKLSEIQKLEGGGDSGQAKSVVFKDMKVTYKDKNQKRITMSPYELFKIEVNKCKEKYSEMSSAPDKSGQIISQEKKVKRGKELLQQLKNVNDSFANEVAQKISEKILNCSGENYKSGNKCNASTLSPSEGSFCMAHASNCANEIQGCYNEANKLVETKKQEMKNLANTYNKSMEAFYARANQMYEQQKAGIVNMTKMIQAKFPGTNFVLPDDMFVKPPELKSDRYGLPVYGDGDLKQVLDGPDSLPEKITKLKQIFKDQQRSVDDMLNDYKDKQEIAMKEQKDRWKTLGENCTKAYNTAAAAKAKEYQEAMKKQAEMDDKVAKFCRKYDSIKDNPMAACGKASSLAEQADEINARLSNQALSMTNKWSNACDAYMNENSNDTIPDPNECADNNTKSCKDALAIKIKRYNQLHPDKVVAKKKIKLNKLCKNSDTVDKDFLKNFINKIPVSKAELKIEDFSSLDEYVSTNEYENNSSDNGILDDLSGFYKKLKIDKNKNFCATLSAINGDDIEQLENDLAEQKKTLSNEKNILDQSQTNKKISEIEEKIKNSKELMALLDNLSDLENDRNIMTEENKKEITFSNIGEQMQGPCDAQSSQMAKNPFEFDLNSFDKGYMKTLGK